MKMNTKIFIASALMLASAVAAPVFAQTATTTTAVTTTVAPAPSAAVAEQPVLEVGAAGKVLLRGTIASVSSGIITVNSWGGTWTVNIPSSASVLPEAVTDYTTQFQAGDFIGVQGTIATNANWTVNATLVRDWTYRATVTAQAKTNLQTAQGMRASAPRDYIGTASNVGASSLTLAAANGTVYTVNPTASAEIVNRNWATIPLTSVSSGDNVRVYGVNVSGTVTARIIRDVTIPLAQGATTTAQ
jgi:hypothetical protein